MDEKDDEQTKGYKYRMNYLCLDRHPYFFVYRYPDTRRKYREHVKKYESWCFDKFHMGVADLLKIDDKTPEQINFLQGYFRFMPVIDSESTMNRLCHHIEGINMNVRSHLKMREGEDMYAVFTHGEFVWNDEVYKAVVGAYERFCGMRGTLVRDSGARELDDKNESNFVDTSLFPGMLYSYVSEVCSNVFDAVSYLMFHLYVEKDRSNKDILWQAYGKEIYEVVRSRAGDTIMFPFLDEDGDIEYLGERYSMEEVEIDRPTHV